MEVEVKNFFLFLFSFFFFFDYWFHLNVFDEYTPLSTCVKKIGDFQKWRMLFYKTQIQEEIDVFTIEMGL